MDENKKLDLECIRCNKIGKWNDALCFECKNKTMDKEKKTTAIVEIFRAKQEAGDFGNPNLDADRIALWLYETLDKEKKTTAISKLIEYLEEMNSCLLKTGGAFFFLSTAISLAKQVEYEIANPTKQ